MAGPVVTGLVCNLTKIKDAVAPQSLRFTNITLESEKYICVRDTPASGDNSIVIVDLSSSAATKPSSRHKMAAADAAVMNPASNVLALKSGTTVQIFNMDMRAKMKNTTMTEEVVFMKWVSSVILALVTPTSVYHWSMEGDQPPQKVFDRTPEMAQCTIMNYRTDSTMQWLVLIGIGPDPANPGQRKGQAQLYSVAKGANKVIDGHAACFCMFRMPGNPQQMNVMCIASNNQPTGGQIFMAEVPPEGQAPTYERVMQQIQMSDPSDFPIALHASSKHGILYLVCRSGWVYLLDVHKGIVIHREKLSGNMAESDNCFMATFQESTNGILAVNMKGEVRSAKVNDAVIVQYVQQRLGNQALAMRLAVSADLGGADEMFQQRFEGLMQAGQVDAAVKLCAEAPRQILRTPQVLMRFQGMQAQPGQQQPSAIYFKYMVDNSKLNKHESVELAKVMLARPQGIQFVKKYLEEHKLEQSEELGDCVAQHDGDLALKIYYEGGAHMKVLRVLVGKQNWDLVIKYVKKESSFPMQWHEILAQIMDMRNPDGAGALATKLAADPEIQLNHSQIVEMFVQRQAIKPATAYLLEVLKDNQPEHAELQTRLLEINLLYSPPQVADQILQHCMISHYDTEKVAQLCERAGLYQRALENYNKLQRDEQKDMMRDVKRCVVNTNTINHEWLVDFFQHLSAEESLEIIQELMSNNARANYKICVQVANKNWEQLELQKLIDIFLGFRAFEALYYFLGSIIRTPTQSNPQGCQEPEAHYRYIEASANVGQLQEVERMTRESQFYPAERTKNFLKEKRLADLWPFINVCDMHGFIDEMVRFLYDSKNLKYIDMYVQKRAPTKTPQVVGSLLDVDCSEEYIKNLIITVGSMVPVDELVEEVEKRGRLKLLQPWLEGRMHTSQDPGVFNALAKIKVDMNQGAKHFLEEHAGKYDPKVVGKYCENRDPTLAVMAYEKGQCDEELIEVTTKNGMFRPQARYLLHRQDPELWASVLESQDEDRIKARKPLIDALVSSALPEATSADEVSTCVKAFMQADLPEHLTTVLEKLVLHSDDGSEFRHNKYLQNLLILTAIKVSKDKVMDYVHRLDSFDATAIADIAAKAGLFEEAFTVYKKQGLHADAIAVLLRNLQNLDRARDYAEKVALPEVWAEVGKAELQAGETSAAIKSFVKADDPSQSMLVIGAVAQDGSPEAYGHLITYLKMCRSGHKTKDELVDTELVYAYAKTERLADLEEFLTSANLAKVGEVGERCYQEGLYSSAKVCFQSVSNFPSLARTLLKLEMWVPAIEAATRAASVKTWKEVCFACIEAKEFRLAAQAAQHIIIVADELDGVIQHYEACGCAEEIMSVLKQGLTSDRAHMGMFTELGILYAKYKPEKLMDHIKLHKQRLNSHKLTATCEKYHLWGEVRMLYVANEEWDAAARVMMEHSVLAWDKEVFKEVLVKVSSVECCYQSVRFYMDEHPDLINDLLTSIIKRIDPERIVTEVESLGRQAGTDYIPVVRPYLETVQDRNLRKVNTALNRLYIEEEDYVALRKSVETYDAIDALELAAELHKHELMELRRIGAYLYKKHGRFRHAMEISKENKLYGDAMQTAADSGDKALVEDLMRFFTDNQLFECYAACLFTCYDYIQPDVALELSWRHKMTDLAMPFLIQVLKHYVDKVDEIAHELRQAKASAEEAVADSQPMQQGGQTLMIGGIPPGMGGGMHMGGGMGMHPGMHPGMQGGMHGGMPMQPGMGF